MPAFSPNRVGGVKGRTGVLAGSAVTLSIEAYDDHYEFFYADGGAAPASLGEAGTVNVSTEVAEGFTGVYFGLYAGARNAAPNFDADFDWFEYSFE